MNYTLIKASSFKTSPWSGGETTELLIYPLNSKYESRNFDFRISTATVKVEESTFTPLPGIIRTLMVLDGEMTLTHKGYHTKKLGPFKTDNFNGGWDTSSIGKCIDFNLMTRGSTEGTVESLHLNKDKQLELPRPVNIKHLVFYIYSGQVRIGKEIIKTGDILIFEKPVGLLDIHSVETCDLVVTTIFQ